MAEQPPRKTAPVLIAVLSALVIAVAVVFFFWSSADEMPVIGELTSFNLINQDGKPTTLTDYAGKVWVADIIFTRCPGPCARMSRHLADLQTNFLDDNVIRFVSLTSDPEFDTPAVLKTYATRFANTSDGKWSFLTGDKTSIRRLAVNDFKFVMVEKPLKDQKVPDDFFIHSTWFVVVDGQGKIRGWKDEHGQLHAYYDSEDDEIRARMVKNVRHLLRFN